jgi:hypothetical protein
MTEGRRDLVRGVLFFLGMAAFGVFVLWLTRPKWQAEMRREEQRYRSIQAGASVEAARRSLASARESTGDMRVRCARDAVAHFTTALAMRANDPELLRGRAEAHDLAGDAAAAERDRRSAKEFEK